MDELYSFWFSEITRAHWFDQSDAFDDLIKDKYTTLLENHTLTDPTNEKLFVTTIILHDQIPRHIYRNDRDKINSYLEPIVSYVNKNMNMLSKLNASEFSFALMPLRHTNNFDLISIVLKETWARIKLNNEVDQYKRFLEATYKRYIKFNNDSSNLKHYRPQQILNMYDQMKYAYLDTKCKEYIRLHKINQMNNIYITIKMFVEKNKIKECIISLSGGVDSMVLSYCLAILGISVKAVHINYANRPECDEEEQIVIRWCSQIGIDCYVRRIDEIKRKECMDHNLRELYETYTKDIRFNSYKNVSGTQVTFLGHGEDDCSKNVGGFGSLVTFLGHNKDDCFENILTNIVSKSHHENLQGMESMCVIAGIPFARPMLTINKKDIYEFADEHHVPFFVDSTPSWSQRGIIRDTVRPALEHWNDKMIDSMFDLSQVVQSLMKFMSNSCDKIADEIKKENKLIMQIDNINFDQIYWNEIFIKLNIRISVKALYNFIEKLEYIKANWLSFPQNYRQKYTLNKTTTIEWFRKDNLLHILFMNKFSK